MVYRRAFCGNPPSPGRPSKGGERSPLAWRIYRTGALSAAEVHKDLDGDLLRQPRHWGSTLSCEIVIGGEWNHELTAEVLSTGSMEKAGGGWLQRAGLTDLRVNSNQRPVKYVGARGEQSVPDHLIAIPAEAPTRLPGQQHHSILLPLQR